MLSWIERGDNLTYRDLLKRLQMLNSSQLDQKAQMIGDGDNYCGDLVRIYIATCDQVRFEGTMYDITDFDEEELKDMEIVAHKGDVFLLGN